MLVADLVAGGLDLLEVEAVNECNWHNKIEAMEDAIRELSYYFAGSGCTAKPDVGEMQRVKALVNRTLEIIDKPDIET